MQLGQYFFNAYFNKHPLNGDLWSYSTAFKYGKKIASHIHTQDVMTAADLGNQINTAVHRRALEDMENLFVRDLEAREPSERSAVGLVFFYPSFNQHPLNGHVARHLNMGQSSLGT